MREGEKGGYPIRPRPRAAKHAQKFVTGAAAAEETNNGRVLTNIPRFLHTQCSLQPTDRFSFVLGGRWANPTLTSFPIFGMSVRSAQNQEIQGKDISEDLRNDLGSQDATLPAA